MNLYMHLIEGKPGYYLPGKYICFVGPYDRLDTTQMFKTSLRHIYAEQKKSKKWHAEHGNGIHSRYSYLRIKVDTWIKP